MRFETGSSPHLHGPASVPRVMAQVLVALIPGVVLHGWLFGWGIVVQIPLAVVAALAAEALMLRLRGRPVRPFLTDLSAVLTAVLLALTLPPTAPWWITVIGVLFAIILAKHLYGGLGYNPFNPAMVGFVVLIISFPREMTAWTAPQTLAENPLSFSQSLAVIFGGHLPGDLTLDAITMATPLDHLKTQLTLDHAVAEILSGVGYGWVTAHAWEILTTGFLLGGIYLLARRIIDWRIPAGMLGGLVAIALIFYLVDSAHYPSPLFHIFSGAALLGAFFIATDPVTASTTPRGRLIYGAGIGILTYVIRTWGGFPDAVAFAVLLMNIAAPTLDYYTQPRIFGARDE